MADFPTRYYVHLGDRDANIPDSYVRVTPAGYDRWNGTDWTPVTDKIVTDLYARSIALGDDFVPVTEAEVH